MEEFSHERKKKLAEKLSNIRHQKDLVNIFEIICLENPNISENNNGMFMLFNNFSNETYYKLEKYISIMQNRKADKTLSNSEEHSDKMKYIPYSHDEFPDQAQLSPKLKYSNKEKNIIKRQRYDTFMNSEENSDNVTSSPIKPIATNKENVSTTAKRTKPTVPKK